MAQVAERFGLTAASVDASEPEVSALEVTFTVPDALTPEWGITQLQQALRGDQADLDALTIHLVAADGTSLLDASADYQGRSGSLSFAPGQDGRFNAIHGHMPLKQPTQG